jgi:hypothetical protein
MGYSTYSGAWWELIHEKNLKSKKSRGTVPLLTLLTYAAD